MGDSDPDWPRDLLRDRGERTPGRLALIDADTGQEWTYAELDEMVDDVASALHSVGIDADATVATLLDSRPLTVALPFATIRLGATLAPLNVELDAATIEGQVERLAPDLLLRSSGSGHLAPESIDGTVRTVYDEGTEDDRATGFGSIGDEGNGDPRPESTPGPAADETALVVFTSGTTGRPKGVRLTVGNLLASAVASATRLGLAPRDRWLSPLATYHVGGIAPYLRSTLYGTAAVLQREFAAAETARVLGDHDVTGVSLVPTMLRRLLDEGWRPGPDLRFVLLGGGPAPDSLLQRCLDRDVPVCPTYGATETASQVATATPGETWSHAGTVGRPLWGTAVDIVDDQGEPAAPEEVGELVVDGPTVSPGYLDESATAATFVEGRFHTGDLGYRDEDGRLWIVGRADDVIVTGGENVQPSTVVAALEANHGVQAAAVVGVADEEWGEHVVALVVPGAEVTADDLREWCRGRIPDFAIPKTIRFADRLPRTPSGTVDREAVRERFS